MSEDKLSSLLIISFEHFSLRTSGIRQAKLRLRKVHKVGLEHAEGAQNEFMPNRLTFNNLHVNSNSNIPSFTNSNVCADYSLKYSILENSKHLVEFRVTRLDKVLISERWETDQPWTIFNLKDDYGWRDNATKRFISHPFEITRDCANTTIIKNCILGDNIEVINNYIGFPAGSLSPFKSIIAHQISANYLPSLIMTRDYKPTLDNSHDILFKVITYVCAKWEECTKYIIDVASKLDHSKASDVASLGKEEWRWVIHSQLTILEFCDQSFLSTFIWCLEKEEQETPVHMHVKDTLKRAIAIVKSSIPELMDMLQAARKMTYEEWRKSRLLERIKMIGLACAELRKLMVVDMKSWAYVLTLISNQLRQIIEELQRKYNGCSRLLEKQFPDPISTVLSKYINSLSKFKINLSLFGDKLMNVNERNDLSLIYAAEHFGYSIVVTKASKHITFDINRLPLTKGANKDTSHTFDIPAITANLLVQDSRNFLLLTWGPTADNKSYEYKINQISLHPLTSHSPQEIFPEVILEGQVDKCQMVMLEGFTSSYLNLLVKPSLTKTLVHSKFGDFLLFRWNGERKLVPAGSFLPETVPTLLGDFYAQNIEFRQFGRHLFIFRMNSNRTTTFMRCLGLKSDGSTELICRTVIDTTRGGHETVRFFEQGTNTFLLFVLPNYTYRLMAVHSRRFLKICKERRIPGTARLESTKALGIVGAPRALYMHVDTVDDLRARKAKILELYVSF